MTRKAVTAPAPDVKSKLSGTSSRDRRRTYATARDRNRPEAAPKAPRLGPLPGATLALSIRHRFRVTTPPQKRAMAGTDAPCLALHPMGQGFAGYQLRPFPGRGKVGWAVLGGRVLGLRRIA